MWPSNKRRLVYGELFLIVILVETYPWVKFHLLLRFRAIQFVLSFSWRRSCNIGADFELSFLPTFCSACGERGRHLQPHPSAGQVQVPVPPKNSNRRLEHRYRNLVPTEYVLQCNVMPYVGLLTNGKAARTASIVFPEAKEPVMTFPLLY